MPEELYMLVTLGVMAGLGCIFWKMYKMENIRKREKIQMKHELKMLRHKPTIKARLNKEKAQMKHELKMNGHDTTTELFIKTVPESLKNIVSIINSWKKK